MDATTKENCGRALDNGAPCEGDALPGSRYAVGYPLCRAHWDADRDAEHHATGASRAADDCERAATAHDYHDASAAYSRCAAFGARIRRAGLVDMADAEYARRADFSLARADRALAGMGA